jgi:resuscitation-promoting factor RpfA
MAGDKSRWKLTGGQGLAASIMLAVAVFLSLMSIGASNISYALAAALIAVVTVVAGVLLGLWHGGTATVLGVAHVITASRPPVGQIVGRCDMVLLVDLPGMDPVTVSHRDPATPVHRWPRTGLVLPVEAAPRNPRNLRIRWNSVPAQAPSLGDEDADVVGPFFTEFGDQPGPEQRPRNQRAGEQRGGDAGVPTPPTDGTAFVGPGATAVILDEPIPPAPGLDSDPPPGSNGARGGGNGASGAQEPAPAGGGRGTSGRPWDDPPPEQGPIPVIDGDLLDDELLDAELIDGQAFIDETFLDETFLDETFLDEALADEMMVDEAPLDQEPVITPFLTPVIPPVIPQQREEPRAEPREEALIGEVVVDTSRVGEAARGIGMMLIVSDLFTSLHFYRDLLGLQAVDVTDRTAELTFGGGRLLLCLVADMSPVNRRVEHLHLDVPDVEAAYHDLRAKGVDFPHAPRVITTRADGSELLAATFRDPDGHAVALTQWRERMDDLP